ncbi:hypothetical protein EDB84DRAFT_931711 [Lactarius hengduanensis]|nr:hypothetical protein EDB84DRAFT_931711 [Lactarius hengduanensis]
MPHNITVKTQLGQSTQAMTDACWSSSLHLNSAQERQICSTGGQRQDSKKRGDSPGTISHEAEPRVSANRVPPNFYQPSHLGPLTSVLSPLNVTTSRAPLDVSLKSPSPLSGAHGRFAYTIASTRPPTVLHGYVWTFTPTAYFGFRGMSSSDQQVARQQRYALVQDARNLGWEALAELSFQFPTPTLSSLLTKRTLTLSVSSCVGRSHMSHAPSKAHFRLGAWAEFLIFSRRRTRVFSAIEP